MNSQFETSLTPDERQLLDSLDSPSAIQAFLDSIHYTADHFNRSPLRVLRERESHCLDGALFAALCLRRLGYPPLVLDMFPDPGADDDHVLALYRLDGRYGALAKSNYSGLRLREAVYRNLRELVMSYFEDFFSVHGNKTLRSYTTVLRLATFDRFGWMESDGGVDAVERKLLSMRRIPLITPQMAARLSEVDQRSYQAGMLGVNKAGLYWPDPDS
jgi:hypothetical protein